MTVTKTFDGPSLSIAVEEWLDTITASRFHDEVQDLKNATQVILDLGGVDYISSAGLRETVSLFRSVTERGGSFMIVRVQPAVADVFTMTGLDRKIDIRKD